MKLGVLKEPSGENRVSIIPASVKKLIKIGFDVTVESGAGILSYHLDEEYQTAGAKISDRTTVLSSDLIISISPPNLSIVRDDPRVICIPGAVSLTRPKS